MSTGKSLVNINTMDTMTLQELEKNINAMLPDLQDVSKHPFVKNPFKSYLKITNLDKVKIALLCFLVPIRLLLLLISLLISIIWASLFMVGYKETDPPEPFGWYRKIGFRGMCVLARVNCVICGFHNVKVIGTVSREARILAVAPHSSAMDIWLLSNIAGGFTPVTKSEFLAIPLIRNLFRMLQSIHISRTDKNSKILAAEEIKRRVNSKEWPPICIFPEGTCTNRTSYVSFKPGAFYPGIPVQPIIIRYLDCTMGAMDYVSWGFIGAHLYQLFPLMLSRLHNRAEIEILPLYIPSQEEIADPVLYAKNVRDYIAKVDNVLTTDHSFEDCRLMNAAKKFNLPMEAGIVEYYKISPMVKMNCNGMIEKLQKFATIDEKCDGVIDIGEFCKYLNLPLIEETETMFRIYDIDKDNFIDFREYLLGTFFISDPLNSKENIELAFSLFDVDAKGYITYNCVASVFQSALGIEETYCRVIFDEIDYGANERVNYEEFFSFCSKKPEYALLFIHFRNLHERKVDL